MSEDFDAARKAGLKKEAAEAEERAAKKRAKAERARKVADQSIEAADAAEKAALAAEAGARAARDRGGRTRRGRPERRSDQLSVRMLPQIREMIENRAAEEGVPIVEIVERAMLAYFHSKEN